MTTIGEKIRKLRLSKGLSQTQLAEKLAISNQAVSKWETNIAQPDITLLPELAIIFGVSIDDLFDYNKDKMYDKITSQLESGYLLSHQEFLTYESFLLDELGHNPTNYRANSELGCLYDSHANHLREKAVQYSKKALELRPNTKTDINIINNASDGACYDWNTASHHNLIEYYQKTLKVAPENKRLYFYLLDNLIADGRLEEAKDTLEQSFEENPDSLNNFYHILIKEKEKGFAQVKEHYLSLVDQHSDDWRVLFSVANEFCRNADYRSAIPIWEKAFEVQEKPRYTDYHDSIALCYLHLGETDNAIETYRKILDILHDEWNIRFSSYIDRVNQKIADLS